MGLLDSDAGKKRLLSVEIPIVERYNHSRDPEFRVRVQRVGGRHRIPGGTDAVLERPSEHEPDRHDEQNGQVAERAEAQQVSSGHSE